MLTTDYCIKMVRATAVGGITGEAKAPRGAEEMKAFLSLIEVRSGEERSDKLRMRDIDDYG